MNTNSEDEIFSILKPVETCLAEDDKARLWARIRKDSLRMRAFRRAAVIAVSAAAAIVAGVAIYFLTLTMIHPIHLRACATPSIRGLRAAC